MKAVKYLFMLIGIWMVVPVLADDLSPEAKTFRSSLMQFLREEGFAPKIDEYNRLTFKKEGELYWFNFYDSSPIYMEFHRLGLNCNDADMDAVVKACNYANQQTRCVKAIMGTTSVSLSIELYCHSVEEFKYTFYKNMDALDYAYEKVKEYYNENENESATPSAAPFTIQSVEVANVENDGTIINDYGKMIFDFQTKYIKPRIYTKVNVPGNYDIYVKLITPNGLSTGSTSLSGYSYKSTITMTQGSKYYFFSGWGANTAGYWDKGNYRFEFYYQGKKIGEQSFTIN